MSPSTFIFEFFLFAALMFARCDDDLASNSLTKSKHCLFFLPQLNLQQSKLLFEVEKEAVAS